MIRLTDGYATVTVEMKTWDEHNQCYTPDRAPEFFDVGGLPIDPSTQTYMVEDVNYCLDQARDSMLHMGTTTTASRATLATPCLWMVTLFWKSPRTMTGPTLGMMTMIGSGSEDNGNRS